MFINHNMLGVSPKQRPLALSCCPIVLTEEPFSTPTDVIVCSPRSDAGSDSAADGEVHSYTHPSQSDPESQRAHYPEGNSSAEGPCSERRLFGHVESYWLQSAWTRRNHCHRQSVQAALYNLLGNSLHAISRLPVGAQFLHAYLIRPIRVSRQIDNTLRQRKSWTERPRFLRSVAYQGENDLAGRPDGSKITYHE
jgi:hypothetical protein